MKTRGIIAVCMATIVAATAGCGPQGGATKGKGIDTTGLKARLPMLVDEAELARLIGHNAEGMHYVLKVDDGGDTITLEGTVGK